MITGRDIRSVCREAFPLAFAMVGIVACVGEDTNPADQGSEDEAYVVTDSASVRIISNFRPASEADLTWQIDAKPMLRIGVEGADGLLFGRVGAAKLRWDGALAVLDGVTYEITVLDSAGKVLGRMGRMGAGPGEFQRQPVIAWSDDATLLAWDPGSIRASWFDEQGNLVRERSLAFLLGGTSVGDGAWQVAADGTLLGSIPTGPLTEQRYRVLSVAPDADTIIDVIQYDYPRGILEAFMVVSSSFAHRPVTRLSPDGLRLYHAGTSEWEVRRFDTRDGSLAEIIRVAVARMPVTRVMISEERDEWRARAGGRLPPSTFIDALDQFEVPDSLPGIYSLYVDAEDHLWIGRRTTRERASPTAFVVLDPSGMWVAKAVVPEGIGSIRDISGNAIVTSTSGPVGEPIVAIHAIRPQP